MLKFHGSPKYISIKYRKTWKFRRAFFKPVSFHRSPWKPRVWHARFKVSVRYNCGIIMFPHGSEPRGRRVWRRSATYDRTRPPHIESQGGLCGYSHFSVRFLLASQPDRSQGEPREWKWMENWWTNNNRCPGERVETLTRGKFITGACLASTFVCRPGTRDLRSINTTAWCKKVSRLISMISFEFELKYSDNISSTVFRLEKAPSVEKRAFLRNIFSFEILFLAIIFRM